MNERLQGVGIAQAVFLQLHSSDAFEPDHQAGRTERRTLYLPARPLDLLFKIPIKRQLAP